MTDYMIRALAKDAGLRGLACVTTDLARDASRRHGASPLAAAALGHGLTAAALLGALLKVQQRVAIKVEGNGPLRKMIVESDSYGRVRGYVGTPGLASPTPIGPNSVARALGQHGLLTVVKDLRLKDLYQGVIALESGQLDQEVARYLIISEQVASVVEIGVRLDDEGELTNAGGVLFQLLPGQGRDALEAVANRLEDLPVLDVLLADGYGPEDILAMTFGAIDYQELETRALSFRCSCSHERSQQALLILGRQEIQALAAEGEAIVDCHFCHERYVFDQAALERLLAELEESP